MLRPPAVPTSPLESLEPNSGTPQPSQRSLARTEGGTFYRVLPSFFLFGSLVNRRPLLDRREGFYAKIKRKNKKKKHGRETPKKKGKNRKIKRKITLAAPWRIGKPRGPASLTRQRADIWCNTFPRFHQREKRRNRFIGWVISSSFIFFLVLWFFLTKKKRKEKKWGARHTSRTMDEIPSDEIVKNTQKKNSNELKFKYVMEIFPIWNKSKRPLWIRTCDKKWKKNRKVVRFCRNHNTFGYAMTKTR